MDALHVARLRDRVHSTPVLIEGHSDLGSWHALPLPKLHAEPHAARKEDPGPAILLAVGTANVGTVHNQ